MEIDGFTTLFNGITIAVALFIVFKVSRLSRRIRARDEGIASAIHELRGALQPIALATARLRRDGGLSPKQEEAVGIIERNLEAETRLIEDLFEAMRDDRPVAVHVEPCDVNPILRELVEAAALRAREKGVDLDVRLDPGAPCASADRLRLRQVVRNLVDNAIKFTPAGGKVTVSTGPGDSGFVAIEVADTGPGIPEEARERIFKPWAQLDAGRAAGGLGLGLFLARKLVVAQGGTLTVASDGPGQGSRFVVSLPRAAEEAAAAAAASPARSPASNGKGGGRILLAEDHEDSARMISDLLRARGYAVTPVGGVAPALAEAAKTRFDVLVSDLELSDGSGLDLARRLVGKGGLGAVALSGRRTETDLASSRAAGFGAHLLKPIDLDELVAAIERVRR